MSYAVSALAVSQGRSFRKHSGLIAYFQKEFIQTNLLNRRHGRAIQKAFEDRSEADYQDYPKLTKEQIRARLDEASGLTTVKDLVPQDLMTAYLNTARGVRRWKKLYIF